MEKQNPSTWLLIVLVIASCIITDGILQLITPIIHFYSQNVWVERGIGIVLVVIVWSIGWALVKKRGLSHENR